MRGPDGAKYVLADNQTRPRSFGVGRDIADQRLK